LDGEKCPANGVLHQGHPACIDLQRLTRPGEDRAGRPSHPPERLPPQPTRQPA